MKENRERPGGGPSRILSRTRSLPLPVLIPYQGSINLNQGFLQFGGSVVADFLLPGATN
jgi:hypothetical protein